jgi:5'-3' exonuclease
LTVYLIDASVFVFRAWFSIPDDMRDSQRNPVNALYGFARFLGDLLEDACPDHVAAAFDESLTTSFRNQLYPAYKANREPAPPELKLQFARCRAVAAALGVPVWADGMFEADDFIGTLAARSRHAGHAVTILSRDKDLAQSLQPGDVLWDYPSGRRVAYEEVPVTYGVRAEQIADFLALTGDAVDNIRGVPGVGPKTATALLNHFPDLEALYAGLDDVPRLAVRGAKGLSARLREHRDAAFLARQLTRLRHDAPVPEGGTATARRAPDLAALTALYDEAGFGEALRRQAERIAQVHIPVGVAAEAAPTAALAV